MNANTSYYQNRTIMDHLRLKRTLLSAAAVAAVAGPCAQALAETSDTLPLVAVRSERAAVLPLQPSAAAERRRLDAVPGGSNLIEPQKESRLATLRDALDYQPGLIIQDFFGATDQPRLNIRGSGIQSNPVNRGVLLMQDGLPLNEADGSFIIGLLEPRNAALISVRRGANAGNPAATTLGGELDFQSLTGADERGRLRLEAGGFGRQGWQLAAGGAGADLDGRISLSGDRFDGYRHHAASQRDSLHANVGWHGGGSFENRSYLSWTDLRFQIPSVVPKDRIESDPQGVMGDGDSAQDKLLNVYKRDPRRAATQTRLANRSRWGDEALQQELGLYGQHTDDLFNNQTSHTVTDSRTLGAQWLLQGRPGGGSGPLGYRLGLAWAGSDMARDLFATNPLNGQQMQRFGHFDLRADNASASLNADWRAAPDWQLVGDLQWNHLARDAHDLSSGTALDQSWRFANPKLGLIWTPAAGTRAYANLSRSHEAPTYWEIVSATVAPNKPAGASVALIKLDVQSASTLELGAQASLGGAAAWPQWSVTLYRSEIDDELISTTDADGIKVGTYNYVGGTRHQGLEAGLNGSWRIAEAGALDYRASWTYSDFRFKGGEYAGKRIAGVPRHLLSAELLWAQGGWRFGPNLRWLPQDTPTDHANTPGTEQDSYALLGLKLDWRRQAWSAYVQADNLADTRYASSYAIRNRASATQPGYLPGVGRSVSAGLSYQFF